MEFIKKEIKNQVVDKLDNMCGGEISDELYDFLEDKTDIVCNSVYEVLSNNECVLDDGIICMTAQEGFSVDLIANWDHLETLEGEKKELEIQSTILYNYDALWMAAIHKAFPNNTTNIQCGWGMMDLVMPE